MLLVLIFISFFLDPEVGSQNATLVVVLVVVVVISSLKIAKAFLIRSGAGAQRHFAYNSHSVLTFRTYCLRFSTYFLINE